MSVNLSRLWTGALIKKGWGGRVPDTSLVRDNAKGGELECASDLSTHR